MSVLTISMRSGSQHCVPCEEKDLDGIMKELLGSLFFTFTTEEGAIVALNSGYIESVVLDQEG